MNNKFALRKLVMPQNCCLVFLATAFFMFVNQISFAQVNTYSFSESVSTYTALATPSVAYAAPWDDHVAGAAFQAPIGFNFDYDGVTQTQCYISPNGFISFGVQPAPNNYLPLSVATAFTNGGTISALGMDLISTSSSATDNIVYSTIGTAPNRIFVVEWNNARRKAVVGNFNFQIRLIETTNRIEISYGACLQSDVTVLNTQVGIRGVTNDFLQGNINNRFQTGANVNFPWSARTVAGTANSNTVRTSVTEYPNTGLKYVYTPSTVCNTPTGIPSSLVIGSTNVTSTSFVGNSFTAATPAPTNYLIVRSNVNTPPTNSDVVNRTYWNVNDLIAGNYIVISNSNATTFVQTGLTPNTTYYYWAIPYNAGCLGGPYYNLANMISASRTTCISEPLGLTASLVEGNSITIEWGAVAGATNYTVDVSTSNTFATFLPGYSAASTSGATSLAITGLSSLTTYYFRVRAIGISCNTDSLTASATTTCGGYPIPYFQSFDSTPVSTLPTCFTLDNANGDSIAWQVQNTISASNPNSYHLVTNTTAATNDWFFTPGLALTSGVTYRLKFKYNTSSGGVYSENLKVSLGNGPSSAAVILTLLDMPGLVNTVYQTATVDFTPASTDIYNIGFLGYSFASQSKIIIDDISVIVSPTCFEPVNVLVTSVTSNTATVIWSEPFPAPANGYQYYVSTSNTLPGASVTPAGSVGFGIRTATITGLTPATLYYVWVRGNCSGSDQSVWSQYDSFSTDCAAAGGLTVVNGTLCGGGSTTLQATPAPGATIEWYNDSVGTTLLATGNNFVTPTLFATTTYYARSRAPGGLILVGPSSPTSQGGSLGVQPAQTYVSFSVTAPTTLQTFDIYPMASGQNGVLTIRNALDVVLGTYPYVTSAAGGTTPQTITLGLNLTVGNYTLYMDTLPAAGLLTNIDSASYPFTSSVANITGNGFDNTYYLYAYNWKFSNICRSLFVPVTATVTTAPPISFSSSTATICSGETTPLVTVSGYASYNNFTWLPSSSGVSGSVAAGFTFNPTVTTTYSLVASQTSGSLCTSVINFIVNVNAAPPAITIVPTNPSLCYGTVQALNANLAATPPVTIYSQNFNGATNDWTTTNLSSGGTPANAAWTLRPAGYNWISAYWNPTTGGVTPVSNDASQYYFTNSDAQGNPGPSPGRTRTYLTSPTFNLAGYTSANFSFWHYLRYTGGDKAYIEASTDGGATWILLTSFATTQGTANGFVNANISLNSLLGFSNVKLRFYYEARWHWGWAVDNVSLTGNLALEVNWSPATDLYFDAAATNPYIIGTPASVVYAKPTSTITYTGTVLGAGGCTVSNTTTLTISPTTVAGTLSGNQNNCASWGATNLVVSGYVGSIIRWEYASDPLFTVGLATIANTTDTLTPAEFGVYNGDRYFRAVIQSGVCSTVNTNSVLVSFYATNWNGTAWSLGAPNATTRATFSGNYSSTANLQACSVEVLSGNVIFNSGHTLTVQNDVRVSGGSLTFEDRASLLQVNTLDNNGIPFTNSGNIVYKRTTTPMYKFDYTYWSSPVSPQLLANVSPQSPFTLFYQYNPLTGSWQYVPPTSTNMVSGKGYIFRAPLNFPVTPASPQTFTASFIGVPNTGTITLPITGGASQFNLLGNPYPSALSADAFLLDADNAATLGGTLYFWTHNTGINAAYQYTGSDYAIYNYLGGVVGGVPTGAATNTGVNNLPPNGKIGSGQGFFIKGLMNGTATFKNTMRLAGNNDQFFKTETTQVSLSNEPEKHRYWLNIANTEGAFKQTLVGYAEGATLGLDRLFDGEMVDVGNAVTLYTMTDNIRLSIQGRPLPFVSSDTIPLGYKSTINSTYTITLADFDGLFADQVIYLEDKELNIIHNLKEAPYTFTTAIGTFENRFVLRYTDQTLGNNDPVFTANSVIIYKGANDNFVITTGAFEMATVKVFDIRGRLLLSKKNINATQTTFNEGKTNQVLLVQITTVDGSKVTRKVVR